jgi:RNA polymerase sigma factor (sigma-70 family)
MHMEIAVRVSEPGPELPAPAPADEAALLARAAGGDGEAFAALYREHVGRVFGLCLRLTADRALAEEHTQESFVRAWENLGRFRAESAFGTWIYRIAANLALGGLRDRNRRGLKVVQGVDQSLVESVAEQASPPYEGIDLERAIEALPPGARAVFVLHDVEGWQHDEIAEQLGLAVGTSKAQLHRARRLLRRRLG